MNSKRFNRNYFTNSFWKIGYYKMFSNLAAIWYTQTTWRNTRFLKISANFVEKWPSCDFFSEFMRFRALKYREIANFPKLKKINSVSEAKWDKDADMHFILEKQWKTYKNIQKGKLLIWQKMEDKKYYYKKRSLSKITLGPHRSKSSFGNIF